jgi:hypothetical protein
MQTGSISFCDSFALNVKSEDIKKDVLNQIQSKYGLKIIQKHFEIYSESSLVKLKNNPYLMQVKSNGNPYFMFLTCINNVNTCLLVDKKIQQGYFYPRMVIVNTMFADCLFSDTIFDGEMTKTNSSEWVFLINDILVLERKNLSDHNLVKRLNIIHLLLDNSYKQHGLFHIQVKKFFKCSEILLLHEFQKSLNYSSRGIVFASMFLKFKNILLNFNASLIKSTHRIKISNINEFIDSPSIEHTQKNEIYSPQIEVKKKFKIKSTGQPDIYEIYENKTYVGTACINSLETSKLLSEIFANTTLQASYDMECIYHPKFSKWIPIQVV